MKPENFAERKRLLFQFGALYAVSIVLLGLVFLMFGNRKPAVNDEFSENTNSSVRLALNRQNRVDTLLRLHAGRLMGLDEQLVRLADSMTASSADVKKAQRDVRIEESAFRKMLDSLEGQGQEWTSLVTSFRSMLDGHNALTHLHPDLDVAGTNNTIGSVLGSANGIASDRREQQESSSSRADRTDTRLINDNAALHLQLEAQEKTNTAIKTQLSVLQRTNDHLMTRLNETDRSAASEDETQKNAGAGRTADLERRAEQLADDLRFAQVDCNLSRADARQIIYNARQRKDLLTDALTTLNELARSPDLEIQRKAKEKIARLRNIASTVHD